MTTEKLISYIESVISELEDSKEEYNIDDIRDEPGYFELKGRIMAYQDILNKLKEGIS
jgi:hypothetical protein